MVPIVRDARTLRARPAGMNSYLAVLKARFRLLLQYRAAALAGLGTQIFWGLMRVMIFTAFYHSTTATPPISLADTVTYLWLIQAMLLLLPWRLDAEIQGMIRDGTVAYELVRPIDLYVEHPPIEEIVARVYAEVAD